MARTATCPECDADVEVTSQTGEIEVGTRVECEECGQYLIVEVLEPLELDYLPNDDEDWDDDEDED